MLENDRGEDTKKRAMLSELSDHQLHELQLNYYQKRGIRYAVHIWRRLVYYWKYGPIDLEEPKKTIFLPTKRDYRIATQILHQRP